MITKLYDFAVTCDIKGPNCNLTAIVERAEDERQARRVMVTKGWTLTLINEICPECFKDRYPEAAPPEVVPE